MNLFVPSIASVKYSYYSVKGQPKGHSFLFKNIQKIFEMQEADLQNESGAAPAPSVCFPHSHQDQGISFPPDVNLFQLLGISGISLPVLKAPFHKFTDLQCSAIKCLLHPFPVLLVRH